jgi:hypothetical protein
LPTSERITMSTAQDRREECGQQPLVAERDAGAATVGGRARDCDPSPSTQIRGDNGQIAEDPIADGDEARAGGRALTPDPLALDPLSPVPLPPGPAVPAGPLTLDPLSPIARTARTPGVRLGSPADARDARVRDPRRVQQYQEGTV